MANLAFLAYFIDLGYLTNFTNLGYLANLACLACFIDLGYLANFTNLGYLANFAFLINLASFSYLRYFTNLGHLANLAYFFNLSYLANFAYLGYLVNFAFLDDLANFIYLVTWLTSLRKQQNKQQVHTPSPQTIAAVTIEGRVMDLLANESCHTSETRNLIGFHGYPSFSIPILWSLVIIAIWLALISVDLFTNRTFFVLNCIFSPSK